MSLAGKRNDFTHGDLMVFASNVGLKSNRANQAIEEIVSAVAQWHEFAERAGVAHSDVSRIERTFRMNLRDK
jgi:serine/threonine-protein kinase HipA